MSDSSCPTPSRRSCQPTSSEMALFSGVDKRGAAQVLRSKKNAFARTNMSGHAVLQTGADDDPIHSPDFRRSSVGASLIVAQGEDGLWYGLVPDEENALGKTQLVSEAGAMWWESIGANRTLFNRTDIEDATLCNYSLAALQECEGAATSKLVRLSLDAISALLGCSDSQAVEALDSLTGCFEGKPRHLAWPNDVNNHPVPGAFARAQDGKVYFIAAPVDAAGLVKPGYGFSTPAAPVGGAKNPMEWIQSSNVTPLGTPYLVGMSVQGVGLGDGILGQYVQSGLQTGSFDVTLAGAPATAKGLWMMARSECAIAGVFTNLLAYTQINGFNYSLVAQNSSFDSTDRTGGGAVPIAVTSGHVNFTLHTQTDQPGSSCAMSGLWVLAWW